MEPPLGVGGGLRYPAVGEIYDARLALFRVGITWRLPTAALYGESCAWRGLVQSLFARQRRVAAALGEHDPTVAAIRLVPTHAGLAGSHAHGCEPARELVRAPRAIWAVGGVYGWTRAPDEGQDTRPSRLEGEEDQETHLTDMVPLVARRRARTVVQQGQAHPTLAASPLTSHTTCRELELHHKRARHSRRCALAARQGAWSYPKAKPAALRAGHRALSAISKRLRRCE